MFDTAEHDTIIFEFTYEVYNFKNEVQVCADHPSASFGFKQKSGKLAPPLPTRPDFSKLTSPPAQVMDGPFWNFGSTVNI